MWQQPDFIPMKIGTPASCSTIGHEGHIHRAGSVWKKAKKKAQPEN